MLQWGRILTDAESVDPIAQPVIPIVASMGPHPNGRGKLAILRRCSLRMLSLQWGRILTDAESSRSCAAACLDSSGFNGAAS